MARRGARMTVASTRIEPGATFIRAKQRPHTHMRAFVHSR
jgi:hypothetical protein